MLHDPTLYFSRLLGLGGDGQVTRPSTVVSCSLVPNQIVITPMKWDRG